MHFITIIPFEFWVFLLVLLFAGVTWGLSGVAITAILMLVLQVARYT